MNVVRCGIEDAPRILAILNDAILTSTALYDYKPRTIDMMVEWFAEKTQGDYPVIGAVNEHNELMGFGTYGKFRLRPAYKYTVEHSIYVDARFRGQGVGEILLQEIIQTARGQDYHVLVAGIDATNEASVALHKKFSFRHAGRIEHAGFKFGRWLDLDFYQLILPTPERPVDG